MANGVIIPAKKTIQYKYYNSQTIAAGGYVVISDSELGGKILNGWRVLGVASYNVSVIQAYIDENEFYMIIKNNGSAQITTNQIYVYYTEP